MGVLQGTSLSEKGFAVGWQCIDICIFVHTVGLFIIKETIKRYKQYKRKDGENTGKFTRTRLS